MYTQLCTEINRSITTVWQSVSIVVGASAILALAEKQVMSLEVAVSLVLLLAAWLACHIVDASMWYNRNLAMIANIERQFLQTSDLKNIHYYFGTHRPNKLFSHLKLQLVLAGGFAGILLLFHFLRRVLPTLGCWECPIGWELVIPYITVLFGSLWLRWTWVHCRDSYQRFLRNSPGIPVDTTGIEYGSDHGTSKP